MQKRRYNNCPSLSPSVFNSGHKVLKVPQSARTDISVSGIHKPRSQVEILEEHSRKHLDREKKKVRSEDEAGRNGRMCVRTKKELRHSRAIRCASTSVEIDITPAKAK